MSSDRRRAVTDWLYRRGKSVAAVVETDANGKGHVLNLQALGLRYSRRLLRMPQASGTADVPGFTTATHRRSAPFVCRSRATVWRRVVDAVLVVSSPDAARQTVHEVVRWGDDRPPLGAAWHGEGMPCLPRLGPPPSSATATSRRKSQGLQAWRSPACRGCRNARLSERDRAKFVLSNPRIGVGRGEDPRRPVAGLR